MVNLHFEQHIKLLSAHPFLREYTDWSPGMMKKMTHTAVSRLLMSKGELLFSEGEVQNHPRMYFLKTGQMEYSRQIDDQVGSSEIVNPFNWFCEAALWTPWEHFGSMQATSECEMLVLNAEVFVKIAIDGE